MNASLTTVDFHGATLIAQRGASPAETLVAMKPVVEGMGLAWQPQLEKIKNHPVLGEGVTTIVMPSEGGRQEMAALPLNRLNFWLATINPNRVPDPDTRARVIEYQTECADVLFAHFFGQATGGRQSRFAKAQTPLARKWQVDHYSRIPAEMLELLEELFGNCTVDEAYAEVIALFGEADAPSRSAIGRFWQFIRRQAGEISPALAVPHAAKTAEQSAMVKSLTVTMELCVPMDKAQRILAIVNE